MVTGLSRPKSAVGPFTHGSKQYRRDRSHQGPLLPFSARVVILVHASCATVSQICNASPPFNYAVADPDSLSLNACPHHVHPVHTARLLIILILNSGLIHLLSSMRKTLSQPQPLTLHEKPTFLDLPTTIAAGTCIFNVKRLSFSGGELDETRRCIPAEARAAGTVLLGPAC